MKKVLISLLAFVLLVAIWFGESRSFFCLDNGNCLTVWKTYGNHCYIIPGKFYGVIKPQDNYIQSANTNTLTIFYAKELPKGIIFSSEQALEVKNDDKNQVSFYDYNRDKERYNHMLYKPGAKKVNDLKDDASMIDIYVLENYATDKNGKNL
jgi:hypothetical protein